jgi:hypothetical protein
MAATAKLDSHVVNRNGLFKHPPLPKKIPFSFSSLKISSYFVNPAPLFERKTPL